MAEEASRSQDTSNQTVFTTRRKFHKDIPANDGQFAAIIRSRGAGVFECSASLADFLRSLHHFDVGAAERRSRLRLAVKPFPQTTRRGRCSHRIGKQLMQAASSIDRSASHQFPRPANKPNRPLFFFGASSSFFGPGSPELSCRTISLMLRVSRAFGAN
jgi:hypothetical protein